MSSGSTSLKHRRRVLHAAGKLNGKPEPVPVPSISISADRVGRPRRRSYRRSLPAWLGSLALHVAVLLACLPLTFATLTGSQFALWAGPSEPIDQPPEPLAELEIEPIDWQPPEVEEAALRGPQLDAMGGSLSDLVDSLPAATAIGNIGTAGVLPGDVGTLMSTGEPDEPGGGAAGAATFFGTRSKGNRFVFVIDNSRSMKDGRFEAAVAELLQSIGAMSRRQSFYVIFVSDQPYPMFYPAPAPDLVPATTANKQRLAQWLQHVELHYGKNRELATAMQLAASLRPHAVYFLWDGRIDDLRVRQEVMAQLTRPNKWGFPVHTLGMGVGLPDSAPANEQNLDAIARAHGGVYRRVDVPTPHRQ
jgi:hypothetical protein